MNTNDIPDQLAALHSALVEKIGSQPWLGVSMDIYSGGRFIIRLHSKTYDEGQIGCAEADDAGACLDQAAEIIAAIPDPETKKQRDWQGKLAGVIDEGHALNLPDEVMTPLRAGSQAMTKNLLTTLGAEVEK